MFTVDHPHLNDPTRNVEHLDWKLEAFDRKMRILSGNDQRQKDNLGLNEANFVEMWHRICKSYSSNKKLAAVINELPDFTGPEDINSYMRAFWNDTNRQGHPKGMQENSNKPESGPRDAVSIHRKWDDYISGAALSINPFPRSDDNPDTCLSDYEALANDYSMVASDIFTAWSKMIELDADLARAVKARSEGQSDAGVKRRG